MHLFLKMHLNPRCKNPCLWCTNKFKLSIDGLDISKNEWQGDIELLLHTFMLVCRVFIRTEATPHIVTTLE